MKKYLKRNIASFDVDPERGFTPLCPDELPVKGGDEIVDELLKNHKYADTHIVSKDAHSRNADWVASEDYPQFSEIAGKNVDMRWNSHCNVGEEGFELLPGLPHVSTYDFVVYKGLEKDMHPYGACYHDFEERISTGVLEFLSHKNIELVIVGGLALDYCVKETIRQLMDRGFDVVLNLASTREIFDKQVILDELTEQGKNTYSGTFHYVNNADELQSFFIKEVTLY